MTLFLLIALGIPAIALAWWLWAHRRLRRLGAAPWLQWMLGVFVALHLCSYAWLFITRRSGLDAPPPDLLTASTYIWYIVVAPLTMLATIAWILGRQLTLRLRSQQRQSPPLTALHPAPASAATLTRRQALAGFALAGAPMIGQVAAVARGAAQWDDFRVRRIDVALPNLPQALHGLTIAHVTDTHVGRFTRGKVLDDIAGKVCELNADLVCFTGDLIDHSISELPDALAMARQFQARSGVYFCEGNHDLFESKHDFRRLVQREGLPLLVNESVTIHARGYPIQLLGLRWGPDSGNTARGRGSCFAENTESLARQLDPSAFPILLAHHPHAFDAAAEAGIPLTLSGHTHGGQLNFAEGFGLVQLRYKYMSGLYTQPTPTGATAACVVSNGTGNWFPLRINAPAEIVLLTLAPA